MDLKYRQSPVYKFFQALHFTYCEDTKNFIEKENGAVIVEDLKLFNKKEWDIISSKLSLKPI